jgi:anti-sigma factor RsiW
MAHLGSDVAAFVDGQLSPAATQAADAHLRECDACEQAVRQQRLLKSRMRTVAAPELPSDLLSTLTGLADDPPQQGWWTRVRRAAPVRAGLVLVSASVAVAAVAYAVGGGTGGIGDRVTPPFEDYTAAFFGSTSRAEPASVTDETVARLTADGWPCHPRLAGDLQRTRAAFEQTGDTIAITYTNGTARMRLYEQTGWLDVDALPGFARRTWGDSPVWVREGSPTLVTWDEGGVVFTMVTDADPARIRRAVAELPNATGATDPITRVGDGLDRMTAWVSAA